MGAFSLSKRGKEAKARIDEEANLMHERGNVNVARNNEMFTKGQRGLENVTERYNQFANTGMGTPTELAGYGEEAVPGLKETVASRSARRAKMGQNVSDFTGGQFGAGQTAQGQWDILNKMGGDIEAQKNADYGDISGARGELARREGETNEQMNARIANTFNEARRNNQAEFERQREAQKGAFARRGAETAGAFQSALNLVRPGSEARAAIAARSFAPQKAQAMGRLRAAGIDPNSPEAASLIGRVDTGRSRAIDDQLAGALEGTANLTLGRARELGDIRERGAGVETKLSLQQLSNDTGLSLDQLSQLSAEQLRSLSAKNAQTREARDLTMQANEKYFGNTRQLDLAKVQQYLQARGMSLQDLGLTQEQLEKASAEDLQNRALQVEQYKIGQGYGQAQFGNRMAANQGAASAANEAFQQGNYADQAGWRERQGALNQNQQTLANEAATSGWGWDLIGGAVNMVAPGAGSMISGAGKGASGLGGGGGGGGFGNFGIPSFGGGGDVAYGPGGKKYNPWAPNFDTSGWFKNAGGGGIG